MKEWLKKFQCSHEWVILHITRYETCDKLLLTCKKCGKLKKNMTVQELIDELEKVEDKSKLIKVDSLYETNDINRTVNSDYVFIIWI